MTLQRLMSSNNDITEEERGNSNKEKEVQEEQKQNSSNINSPSIDQIIDIDDDELTEEDIELPIKRRRTKRVSPQRRRAARGWSSLTQNESLLQTQDFHSKMCQGIVTNVPAIGDQFQRLISLVRKDLIGQKCLVQIQRSTKLPLIPPINIAWYVIYFTYIYTLYIYIRIYIYIA